jgi:MarR family transcriptional regulator, negative regulator of the multidrug operon emrRAB
MTRSYIVRRVPSIARDANLLGALSLAVAGGMLDGGPRAAELGPSGAPALLALSSWLDGGSIEQLRAILEITHSGAVRLVDRLAAAGLVERRAGPDGRTAALGVTAEGARAADEVRGERAAAIEAVLAPLDAADRERLERVLETLLGGIARGPAPPGRICRMCDAVACGHYEGRCPVTEAARAARPR